MVRSVVSNLYETNATATALLFNYFNIDNAIHKILIKIYIYSNN